MGQLGGRGLSRSEQITGRERDRIAALLRERYEQGATIRALVTQTGRSYGWIALCCWKPGSCCAPGAATTASAGRGAATSDN